MGKKLFVGNLAYSCDEEALREAFGAEGRTVTSVKIITDRETGRPRGFAFVEMGSDDDAQKAVGALNGQQLQGRPLTVNEAHDQSAGPRRGGGGAGSRPPRGAPR
jgi:RNA recognition motif-containing protein